MSSKSLLGGAMAMNLIKTGHDVSVWNRTASKTVQFRNEGATVYDTKRQIVENCDIIFGKKHAFILYPPQNKFQPAFLIPKPQETLSLEMAAF